MKTMLRVFAPLMLVGVAAPAFAQYSTGYYPYSSDRPVQWYVDGGGAITEGQAASYFDNGGILGGGVQFRQPGQPFMLRADFEFGYFDANEQFLAQAAPNANYGAMQTFSGFLDGVLQAPVSPWARFYVLAGVGLGYRTIHASQTGFFCNAFVCSGYGGNASAYDNSTGFAWNAGVGVDFPLPGGSSWFIEARYERFETSYFPTELIPIRFGFRF
jgi:opacity protein-like surface antigen